jgi:hypothetical protein
MKYLKIFEEYNDMFQYKDNYVEVQKIVYGPNKGKIRFYFYEPSTDEHHLGTLDRYSTSLLLGCYKLLGTKYETMSEIRDIKLDSEPKFRKVQTNTADTIMKRLMVDLGYEENMYAHLPKLREPIRAIFEPKLKQLPIEAKKLGDIIDWIRKFRDDFFAFQREEFEQWELERSMKKYNL